MNYIFALILLLPVLASAQQVKTVTSGINTLIADPAIATVTQTGQLTINGGGGGGGVTTFNTRNGAVTLLNTDVNGLSGLTINTTGSAGSLLNGSGGTLTTTGTGLIILAGSSGTLNIGTGGTLGSNAFTSTAYAPLASPALTGTPTINGSALTLGGSLTTSGAFSSTFTMTGATMVTFPTTGTLATTTGSVANFTGNLSGAVTGTQGATVIGSGLSAGLLKNPSSGGTPSIAVGQTDYTVPGASSVSLCFPSSSNMIMDLDFTGSPDDMLALGSEVTFMQRGESNLIGVLTDTYNTAPAPAISIALHYGGFGAIPVGAFQSATTPSDGTQTLPLSIVTAWPTLGTFSGNNGETNAPSSIIVGRTQLVNAPHKSVVYFIAGGWSTLNYLLNSPADAISPLTGTQLFSDRVKEVFVMGGSATTGTEHNLGEDPASANAALATLNSMSPVIMRQWFPTEMSTAFTTAPSAFSVANSPTSLVSTLSITWDCWALYLCVRGLSYNGNTYATLTQGSQSINGTTGANTFTAGTGNDYMLAFSGSGQTQMVTDETILLRQSNLNASPPTAFGVVNANSGSIAGSWSAGSLAVNGLATIGGSAGNSSLTATISGNNASAAFQAFQGSLSAGQSVVIRIGKSLTTGQSLELYYIDGTVTLGVRNDPPIVINASGVVTFPAATASTSAVFNSSKQLVSATAGSTFAGNNGTPTVVYGTGANTPTATSIVGNGESGTITFTTGATPATASTLLTATFASSFAYANGSTVVIYPGNGAAALLTGTSMLNSTGNTTTFVLTSGTAALTGLTTYILQYQVKGY